MLSTIILVSEASFSHAPYAFTCDHNEPFLENIGVELHELTEDDDAESATPLRDVTTTKLVLRTDQQTIEKGCYTFGRDPKRCDIVLAAEKSSGVSQTHFMIRPSPTSDAVIVQNLSQHLTTFKRQNEEQRLTRNGSHFIPFQEEIKLKAGAVSLSIFIPKHPGFEEAWAVFRGLFNFSCLQARAQPKSTETPLIIVGPQSRKSLRIENRTILGRGGSAIVYKAHDISQETVYAAKKITKRQKTGEELNIEILRTLIHDHVIRHFDLIADYSPSEQLMILELAGKPLSEATLDTAGTRTVLKQLAGAVVYIHGENVRHRDIKPDNILLNSRNIVKLIDFELATRQAESALRCGTIPYAAPEILQGRLYSPKEVDMWSLGVVCLVQLFGLQYEGTIKGNYAGTIGDFAATQDGPLAAATRKLLDLDPYLRGTAASFESELDSIS